MGFKSFNIKKEYPFLYKKYYKTKNKVNNSNTPVYNQRIKIYSNGQVSFRKYKTSLSNSEKKEKKTVHDLFTDYAKITFINDVWHLNGCGKIKRISDVSIKDKKNSDKKEGLKEIRKDSLSRTRNAIYDYAYNQYSEWCSFITLTFKNNVTDIESANKIFNKWCVKYRRHLKDYQNIDFKYLGVPEFQKNGRVHYHLLTNVPCGTSALGHQYNNCDNLPVMYHGLKGKSVKSVRYDKRFKRYYHNYNVKFWEGDIGYSSALNFAECDERFDPVKYMLKYLYKDLDNRLFGKKKILKSNNLELPLQIKTIEGLYSALEVYCDYLINEKKGTKKEYSFSPEQGFAIPFDEKTYYIDNNNNNITDLKKVVDDLINPKEDYTLIMDFLDIYA